MTFLDFVDDADVVTPPELFETCRLELSPGALEQARAEGVQRIRRYVQKMALAQQQLEILVAAGELALRHGCHVALEKFGKIYQRFRGTRSRCRDLRAPR